ncbi:MAG: glycosyltransferase family 39 protein [Flavobacteriales bacterium]|nr:glycosyltransferase family 39 protein [Flavobacteriales bacterium]
MKKRFHIRLIWIICILSFLSAYFVNELNLKYIPEPQLRNGQTIATNDDVSYLKPAENYIATGEWKDNAIGKQSYFIRPPGYGMIYYLTRKVSSSENALKLLKLIQLLLFGLSVYWLYHIAESIFNHKKISYLLCILYGIFPIASGFLYYTLTEAVTPALLLYFIYLLFQAEQHAVITKKRGYYLAASLVFSFILLVRPALGLFIILIPVFILKDYARKGLKKTLIRIGFYSLLAFIPFTAWQIRNYNITGKVVGLHPIYYADGNSIYRPTLKAYWNFSSGFAQEGKEVHAYMVPMWQAAIQGDTSIRYINAAISSFPDHVVTYFGKDRLTDVFRKYQIATLHQKPFYKLRKPMPEEIPGPELDFIQEIDLLTDEFKQKFWIEYYLVSPLKVFKTMAFHSNLNLYLFQHQFRGKLLTETTRYISFGIHGAAFILLLICLLLMRWMDWRIGVLALIVFSYVFYLCFFQRGIEERYTLPVLSLLLLIALETGRKTLNRLR